MQSSILCPACDDIFNWSHAYLLHGRSEPSSRNRWKPSTSGCHLCAIFSYVLDRTLIDSLGEQGEMAITRVGSGYTSLKAQIFAVDKDGKNLWTYPELLINSVDFSFERRSKHSLELASSCSIPRASTWSLATVNQIKSWLSMCTENHLECSRPSDSARLPLRLIDVDPDGCISEPPTSEVDLDRFSIQTLPRIRVCSTADLPKATEYLTLSHRWDSTPTIRLSGDTQSQFSKEIPLSLLNERGSKTFRDAVAVTRCLGLRYLWIDAICIDQENRDELATEISAMEYIYANGTCNLSATSAYTAKDGLFFESPNVSRIQPCQKVFPAPDDSDSAEVVIVTAVLHDHWQAFLDSSPLNRRGWVFQERMLSPRVIHFAQPQVYWECFAMQASENHVRCLHAALDEPAIVSGRPTASKKTLTADAGGESGYEQWQAIARAYSRLSLTKSEDRLPAISALARYYGKRRMIQAEYYIAGCWSLDLPVCLDWAVERGVVTSMGYGRRSEEKYIAPSWSWVSVDWPVRRPNWKPSASSDILAETVDFSIVSERGDSFGKIKSGYIRLRCSLCQARWNPRTELLEIVSNNDHLSSRKFFLTWDSSFFTTGVPRTDETYASISGLTGRIRVLGGTQTWRGKEFWVPLPEDGRVCIADNLFFLMPLIRNAVHISGLMLYRTGQQGQYVRVGEFGYLPTYEWQFDQSEEDWESEMGEEDKQSEKSKEERESDMGEEDTESTMDKDAEWQFGMIKEDVDITSALLGKHQNIQEEDIKEATKDGKWIIEII